jgi:hypothetical protein
LCSNAYLRLLPDGSLSLDAPGESLEYRLMPRPDGDADVLLAAREMQSHLTTPDADEGVATQVRHSTSAEAADIAEFELPAENLELARSLAVLPKTEAAVAPDGTVFVVALDAGMVYRVTLPREIRAHSLGGQLARTSFGP